MFTIKWQELKRKRIITKEEAFNTEDELNQFFSFIVSKRRFIQVLSWTR